MLKFIAGVIVGRYFKDELNEAYNWLKKQILILISKIKN